MDSSQAPAPAQQPTSQPASAPTRLRLDFQWLKFKTYISDEKDKKKRLYTLHYRPLTPQLRFRNNATQQIFGTGGLHFLSVDADYDIHGREDVMVAQKRWGLTYSFRSMALSTNGLPVTLHWVSESGFKNWDFVCVDEQQMPLAKFTTNIWGMKHIASIEFTGPMANSQAFREEVIVTGTTLSYCAALRATSLSGLASTLASDPAHDKKYAVQPQGPDHGQYAAYGSPPAYGPPAESSTATGAQPPGDNQAVQRKGQPAQSQPQTSA